MKQHTAHGLSPPPPSRFIGCEADDDVEASGQFADLRPLQGLEIDEDEFPLERIAGFAQDAVPLVLGVAVDEDLRGKQFSAALLDLDVNVRRSPGIGDGLDRPEAVLALGAGGEGAEPLEVLVGPPAAIALRDVAPLLSHCQISTTALLIGSPARLSTLPDR
jgi:hypothetical protein